jgi:hypothetical protein
MAEMSEELFLDVTVGKYTVQMEQGGRLYALRYGEPWRELVGDKLGFALATEVRKLRGQLEKARGVPLYTNPMPDPPGVLCPDCGNQMDIPTAHPVGPEDGWSLQWHCVNQCGKLDLVIPWPFKKRDWADQADMERAGFTVIE